MPERQQCFKQHMSPAGIFSQVLYEGASPRARGKHLPPNHCVMPFKSRPDDLCECLCDLGRLQVLPRQHENAIHQIADGGVLHLLWWDTRNDLCYSPARPIGNCSDGSVVPALDVFATTSSDGGATFAPSVRVTQVTSAPNYEQFSSRTVPFAGDYLWITSMGNFSYGTWTDYRDTVVGSDQREGAGDTYDADTGADVLQCRTFDAASQTYSGDTCPRAGGLDQNIYGDGTP